jgi:phosphomethylpyrimidine synthase
LCYVTPAEHLCLPDKNDVRDGVIVTRIAAHAADLARGIDRDIDRTFSQAREDLNWDEMFRLCIDPVKAKQYRAKRLPSEDTSACSMCGKLCAIEMVKTYLNEQEKPYKKIYKNKSK